jgi:hypothetical protein
MKVKDCGQMFSLISKLHDLYVQETWQIVGLTVVRREGEAEEEYNKRVDAARDQIHQRLLVLLHGCVQVPQYLAMMKMTKAS